MMTAEKNWNGKPLGELLTPWRADANFILRRIGWAWYGRASYYEDFFFNRDYFVSFFVNVAAEYDFERGGSLVAFRKRLERLSEFSKDLPSYANPISEALWRVSQAISEENLEPFLKEEEIRMIVRLGHEFVRRVNLGYRPPFEQLPFVPPLSYFDGLRVVPDISMHELVGLLERN